MEEKSTFGRFVNQKRKEAGLTQKELANQIYVTESAVSKWERGISYPDITLVTGICEALHITEHELVTASEDYRTREIEHQAKKFRTINKSYQSTWYALYGISLLVCFICNLAVNHELSWFFIVLTGEAVGFTLTSLPVLIKKDKGFWTAVSFYAALNLLLVTCRLLLGGGWFLITESALLFSFSLIMLPPILKRLPLGDTLGNNKTLLYYVVNTLLLVLLVTVTMLVCNATGDLIRIGYPIIVFESIWAWAMMAVIRYAKIHGFFKSAICLIISGFYTFIQNSVLSVIIDKKSFEWPKVNFLEWDITNTNGNVGAIILIVCLVIAVLFIVGGIQMTIRKEK